MQKFHIKGGFMDDARKGFVALLLLKALINFKGSWIVFGTDEASTVARLIEIGEITFQEAQDFVSFVNFSIKRHGPRGLPRVMTETQREISDTCFKYWTERQGFEFGDHSLEGMVQDLCTRENDIHEEEFLEYWGTVMICVIARKCLPLSEVSIDQKLVY